MKRTYLSKISYILKLICFTVMLSIVLLPTSSVKATSLHRQGGTATEPSKKQNTVSITPNDLIGRYNLNYTGNINWHCQWITGAKNGEPGGYSSCDVYNDLNFPQYINFSDYQKGITQYYTKDNYGQSIISSFNSNQIKPNSSTATIAPSNPDSKIAAAYLIWYYRDSGRMFDYYDDPVFLSTPGGGSYIPVSPSQTCVDTRYGIDSLLCSMADVTSIVKQYGYGTYGVANIPFWYQTNPKPIYGATAGSTTGSWELIIVEESASNPVRYVGFEIGSSFIENGLAESIPLKNGLKTRPSGNTDGQVFLSGTFGQPQKTDGTTSSIYNVLTSNTLSTPLKGGIISAGTCSKNGQNLPIHSNSNTFFTQLEHFSHVGNNATKITSQTQGFNGWDTYFCFGLAVELAFPAFEGQQKTTCSVDDSLVTITGGYKNVTTDTDTGVAGGKLTVQIDDELTPISSILNLTLTNGQTKQILGKYDLATHKVTFDNTDLLRKGDSFSYEIKCQITSQKDDRFNNSDELSGYLYSNGARVSGLPVAKASSSSSYFYLIVELTLDQQGGAIDGLGVTSTGTQKFYEYYASGFYKDAAHTQSIVRIDIPTKKGCQFMGYYTGTNGSGKQCVAANGMITAENTDFLDDTTLYAYWTPGVYAVIDADTKNTVFYEKYTIGFFTTRTLNTNGITYDASGQITSISSAPSKRGNTYKGYFTAPLGGGSQYVLEDKKICMYNNWITADTFVYAKWAPIQYTITCNKNGGKYGTDKFFELYGNSFLWNGPVITAGEKAPKQTYDKAGSYTYTAPYTGTYYLEVYGAQGSDSVNGKTGTGGRGGYAAGCIDLIQGEPLYIHVGGQGSGKTGGGNGGANGDGGTWWGRSGGGGATDIRKENDTLESRIIVAGGGGGFMHTPGGNTASGGAGGYYTGTQRVNQTVGFFYYPNKNGANPADNNNYHGPVTSIPNDSWYGPAYSKATLGNASAPGGGGGYYGGNTDIYSVLTTQPNSTWNIFPAGAGGTNYTDGVKNGSVGGNPKTVSSIPGKRTGNGYAVITENNYTTTQQPTTTINIPKRDGYIFQGYYTTTAGGIKVVDSTGKICVSPDFFEQSTTIYAIWGTAAPLETYSVEFDGNGAKGGYVAPMTCVLNQTYMFPKNGFTNPGYTFQGWAKTASGDVAYNEDQYFNKDTLSAKNGDKFKFYAVWKDLIPPILSDNTPDENGGLPNISNVEGEIEYPWVNHEVKLSFKASDNVAVKNITLTDENNNRYIGTTSVDYTVKKEGITKYTIVAEDTSGNTATLKVTVKIDYHAPTGKKSVSYDGYNLTANLTDITEELSGCDKAWIITEAYDENGFLIRTDTRDLDLTTPGNIHNDAAYGKTFALEDEYNYAAAYMLVKFRIRDIAGNEREIGDPELLDTFWVRGFVTRALGEAEYWKAGEAGYVDVTTGAYVDKLYITYPDKWTNLDDTLGTHTFDYTGNQELEKVERDEFYIPLRAKDGEYTLLVTAEKNGYTKTVELPVKTNGNVVSELRTRLRYNPDMYPIFKDEP